MSEKSKRNLEMEMDALKNDLSEIMELLRGGKKHTTNKKEKRIDNIANVEEEDDEDEKDTVTTTVSEEKVIYGSYEVLSGDDWNDENPEIKELSQIKKRFEEICRQRGDSGKVSYLGVFENDNSRRTFSWIKHGLNTDELLDLVETRAAEKVLNCIGNNDRLNILLAILKKPMTVAELVADGGYNSTGQVYHHLKPLIAADLVAEDKNWHKGTYSVQAHKVQGIIMLLAGIKDMFDGSTEDAWTITNPRESAHQE